MTAYDKALQTRSDLISGSGYHHELSRDDDSDDDFADAARSALKVNNLDNVVPVVPFNFDNSGRQKILQ